MISSRKMASSFIDAWWRWVTTCRPKSSSVAPYWDMYRCVNIPAHCTGLPAPNGTRNWRSPAARCSIDVIGWLAPAPFTSAELLGCWPITRSASAVWQKPDATAAIACAAEYENAGAIKPVAHQLTGSMPSSQASLSGSVPTDVTPSMSCTVSPASASAAMVAWIMWSSIDRPVLRPTWEYPQPTMATRCPVAIRPPRRSRRQAGRTAG